MNIDQVSSQSQAIFSGLNSKNRAERLPGATTQAEKKTLFSGNSAIVAEIMQRYDVKSSTPQQMADLSQELYNSGAINLQQHALLSFQPELNPDYEQMTGQPADLTSKRNYIAIWEDRVEQDKTFNAPPEQVKHTKDILNILKNLDEIDPDK